MSKKPLPALNVSGQVTNQADIDKSGELDDEATGTIGLAVEDDQLAHIRSARTTKQSWDALKNYHEKNKLANKVYLVRSISALKLEEGGDVRTHILKSNARLVHEIKRHR